jgi:uroporphyrinogen-III synthase
MRILVTRPEPDASEQRDNLAALGHEVSVEPMLRIELQAIPADAFDGAQGILLTSRNALRALAASEALEAALELPVFTVGPDTEALARSMGFEQITAGRAAARDLVPLIVNKTDQAGGPLVHLAGETLAFDLAGALETYDLAVTTLTAYRTEPATAIGPATAHKIREGAFDAVLLMSPRTSEIFAQLATGQGLEEGAKKLTYICLSANVAAPLRDLGPTRIEIAAAPNSAAMLVAVARVASQSTGV